MTRAARRAVSSPSSPFATSRARPKASSGASGWRTPSARAWPNVPGLQVVTPRAAVEAVDDQLQLRRASRAASAPTRCSPGPLQRENDRFRITYRILDAKGIQIAANAHRRVRALRSPGPRGRQRRQGPAAAAPRRSARRRRPASTRRPLQERYLEAVGLLQRYDRREGVEKALAILQKLAEEKPNSALVQAALARARPRDVPVHAGADLGRPRHRRQRRRARPRPGTARGRRDARRDAARDRPRRKRRSRPSGGRWPPGPERARAPRSRTRRRGRPATARPPRPRSAGRSSSSPPSPSSISSPRSTTTSAATREAADMFRRASPAAPDSYWAL